MTLFCPTCQTYLSDADVCPACGQPWPQSPTATPHWTVTLNVAAYGTPVAAGGLLFLLASEGMPVQHTTLLALDLSTREVRWRCRLDNLLVNDPVLAHDDALVVAARSTDPLGEGLLLTLDAATGKERWRWTPGAQAVSAPALVDGDLYVTLDGGELWSVEASSGDKGWNLQLPMPRSVAAPLASPDVPHWLFLPSRGPHLCAVDITSREVVWHYTSPDDAGNWFLKTPALAGGRLFAASTGGAVLALDAETGDRFWRIVPGRAGKPLTAPAAAGQRVYVGGHDHYIYALDAASGETVWRRETARRIEGRPLLLDDILYVVGHDHYLRALDATTGRDLWLVELLRRIEGGPALAGDMVLAADREGNVVAVERVLAAETYAAQARWPEAAAAYARRGDLPAAARIYEERLNEPLHAAELWWAADRPSRAAPLYRQAGVEDKALAAYRRAAERAAAAGDHLQAGEGYAAIEDWASAGEQYERAGRPDLAAPALEKAGQISRAAECYKQARCWAEAARLYELTETWSQAVRCYERAGNWEQVGRLQRQLGNFEAAASAFIQAARNLEETAVPDKAHLAELWSAAEECCRETFDEAQAEVCRRQVARYRGLPYIKVEIVPQEAMVVERYASLEFILHNVGGGEAQRVVVHQTPSEFMGELSRSMEIQGLLPGQELRQSLSVRPLASGPVPLVVAIDYADKDDNLYEITYRTRIAVSESHEPPAALPETTAMKRDQVKLDVLSILYQAYRVEPGEKVSSEQIRETLGLSHEQMNDIILVLRERGFVEADFIDNRALLRITVDGVTIAKNLEPPVAKEQQEYQRRIDAAAPSHAKVGQSIDLFVQVRFPDSPLLSIEDWPIKQEPASIKQAWEPVALKFPVNRRTGRLGSAHLKVRVVAPDFKIEGKAEQLVEVPPAQYSKRMSFLLTPKKAGSCRINVGVYSIDDSYLGTIPIEVKTAIDKRAIASVSQVANLVIVILIAKESLPDTVSGLPEFPPAPLETTVMIAALADFDLLIGRRSEDVYPVHVVRSPGGEAKGSLSPSFAPQELAGVWQKLEDDEAGEDLMRDVGTRLFEALFRGNVGHRFRTSQGMVTQGRGLRLRLRVESGDLIALPWELLYDPERREFLSLTRRALVVRHLEVPRPAVPPPVSPPLQMLIVPASPRGLGPLDVQKEAKALCEAVQPLMDDGLVAWEVLRPPTAQALRAYLVDHPCHILHFIGHGDFDGREGYIVLEDARGRIKRLSAQVLRVLLANAPVRLAVLNACLTARDAVHHGVGVSKRGYLGVAPALVDAGLPAVVAMQFSLSDEGARVFAQDFYQMLARRRPVDEAVDQARVAVMLELGLEHRDWAAPVLFMRGSTGELFPPARSRF